jgi:hypothetical protein
VDGARIVGVVLNACREDGHQHYDLHPPLPLNRRLK